MIPLSPCIWNAYACELLIAIEALADTIAKLILRPKWNIANVFSKVKWQLTCISGLTLISWHQPAMCIEAVIVIHMPGPQTFDKCTMHDDAKHR